MPATFSRAQIEAIASLAHLRLDEEEIELYARQLGEILEYATQVQNIDTTGVPPTASVLARHEADRADVIHASLDRADALANAPDASLEAGLFKVPRVLG
ncbi:MAG TPA: Asp-tRNA(Asn)/Glu-tRNA(Gln) amidotransferase subunit GatC [Vicinamibacterales bacterium]|nr:Asp-tRNA(Asn)/Glu-tRNA(Gln) amidotransferase subunit GatC [Vicinamibacterales bacterium]